MPVDWVARLDASGRHAFPVKSPMMCAKSGDRDGGELEAGRGLRQTLDAHAASAGNPEVMPRSARGAASEDDVRLIRDEHLLRWIGSCSARV